LLDLFIGRQVSPSSTLFDDLPFFVGYVVVTATPLFNLADEARHPLLIGGRPTQDAIEDFLDLISCHDGRSKSAGGGRRVLQQWEIQRRNSDRIKPRLNV
jgi:hypothetical protein